MTTLNSKLQLAMINRKKSRNLLEKGFTLVELMIVIVIVGVLSAVALPNLLGNRDRAEAQSQIGSMMSFAKQCSSNMLTDNPLDIENIPDYITMDPDDDTECFDSGAAVQTTFTSATFTNTANLEGLSCGRTAANLALEASNDGTGEICTLTVHDGTSQDRGVVTGEWS